MEGSRTVATAVVIGWLVLIAGAAGAQTAGIGVGEQAQLSTMGPDGDVDHRADRPAIAYNSVDDEFLVVWIGTDIVPPSPGQRHSEIYGQRIDATTGQEVGTDDFRISFVGEDDQANLFAGVTVAHNPEANEYLVAWLASAVTTNPPFQVHVRRIDAATGELLGEQRIITDYETLIPSFGIDAVYNPISDEYLVVWEGTDDSPEPPVERFEYEVYGQRLDAEANEVGPSQIRISQIIGDGRIEGANVEVFDVRVAHNPSANEYLVVWDALAFIGDEVLRADLEIEQYYVDQEYEVFGQRLDAEGNEIGENDFLISSTELPGPPPEPLPAEVAEDELDELPSRSDVLRPRVVFNPVRDEFLVVWAEDGEENGQAEREFEVFGRRLAAGGSFAGSKFRITDHGLGGALEFSIFEPDVAYDPERDHYLVVYNAADPAGTPLDPDAPLSDNGPVFINESEIFGRWLDGDGTLLYDDVAQLSEAGPAGDGAYDASNPVVAHSAASGEFFVAWSGNDPTLGVGRSEFAGREQVIYEVEVFGRRILEPPPSPEPTTITTTATTTTITTTPPTTAPATTAPGEDTTTVTPVPAASQEDGGGSGGLLIVMIGAAAAVGVLLAGAVLVRRRRAS